MSKISLPTEEEMAAALEKLVVVQKKFRADHGIRDGKAMTVRMDPKTGGLIIEEAKEQD